MSEKNELDYNTNLNNHSTKISFPKHWGWPPKERVKDLIILPGEYGMGSSTLSNWIRRNITADGLTEVIPVNQKYPSSWGNEPDIQTTDIVELPYGLGKGSSTLKIWINSF